MKEGHVGIFIGLSGLVAMLYAGMSNAWLLSGAPLLSLCLVAGGKDRVLAYAPLWVLLVALNGTYLITSTSWLLLWVFAAVVYPSIFVVCIFQFGIASRIVQRLLRQILRELHFTADKIALFDLPALEIDRDVDGLMVIRGVTISLSTLTICAHGVEVGIKLSDDLELALVVDLVTIKLFRRIEIGDIYGNVKGGEHEMNFHELAPNTKNSNGEALMDEEVLNKDSRMLDAARSSVDLLSRDKTKMTDRMTKDEAPKSIESPEQALKKAKPVNAREHKAAQRYQDALQNIHDTSIVVQSIEKVKSRLSIADNGTSDKLDDKDLRAAVCAELHNRPTVSHPPAHSVKVTTLQALSPPYVRRFLHRLPLLLRVLLNVLSHFHPVFIQSITAGGSGTWLESMIDQFVFKGYTHGSADIQNLHTRLSRWLSDASFCLQLDHINGVAQVPVNVSFDIVALLKFNDVMLYRTTSALNVLKEVVRLGGADATVTVPTYLLPHHEHLLPDRPSKDEERDKRRQAEEADGLPKAVQAQRDLRRAQLDQTNASVSSHVHLPACFDQELLDFIAALVKASKIVEIERDTDELVEGEARGVRELARSTKEKLKHGLEKATVDAVANDRWIARLVGKVTRKLETLEGDVGYSGDVPIALQPYREQAEAASKILP